MKSRTLTLAAAFLAGTLIGVSALPLRTSAQAAATDWEEVAKDPAFRAAVIEVLNGCIVDAGIIYCN
jgi:hypothetical protein